MNWKRLRIGPYESGMLVIVIAAALLRIVLISQNWPATNSDEGTMDLMALHIAYRGEHPIFFYGQDYMGPIEAYIGALCFQFFGASVFAVRMGLIPFFVLFLVCMYFLTRQLYTRPLALVTVALLSLGSNPVILYQLRAIGGYPEIVLFAALIFLLASHLALSSHLFFDAPATRERRWRWLVYGLLGIVTGLAIWTDQLILPCIVAAAALLFLFCRREILRSRAGLFLLLGLLLGASPLIYFNLTAPPGHNSLNTLLDLQRSGANDVAGLGIPLIRQIAGTLLIALPTATSYNPLCAVKSFPLFGTEASQQWQCTVLQGGWSLGYLLLWAIAVFLAVNLVWKQWRQIPRQSWSFMERQECIRQCARLMLLLSAGMTLGIYVLSAAPARVPDTSFRYLICMQLATPALLWPLWHGVVHHSYVPHVVRFISRTALLFRIAVLLLIATVFFMGTIGVINDIPNGQTAYQQRTALVHDLLKVGATRVYSDYWTCNWLTFQSQEQIICSTLNTNLQPDLDRYLPYRTMLRATAHPAYVFSTNPTSIGPKQAATFERDIRSRNNQYQQYIFDHYIVYI